MRLACINNAGCVSTALVIQNVKCMRHITLSNMACPVISRFSTLVHTQHVFWKTLLIIKRVFQFPLQFIWNTSYSTKRIQHDITNVRRAWCKVPINCCQNL